MRNPENQKIEMVAYEAFLKRASIINMPFMLKGSYVTRQYLPADVARFPADMDWVYMYYLHREDDAAYVFSQWLTEITELETGDGIAFRSFKENKFWRMMDYAMADDFPTVNTDLLCTVHGHEIGLKIDISFNLGIEQPPIPLLYNPIEGPPFTVPFTVPLSLQVSWKIHQSLVRPRFKDFFDLTYLVIHPLFNADVRLAALQALVNECAEDSIGHETLISFFNYEFEKLFRSEPINKAWNFWVEVEGDITGIDKAPTGLNVFLQNLSTNLEAAGMVRELLAQPPLAGYIENSMLRQAEHIITQPPISDNDSILKRFIKWVSGNK